MSETTTRIAHLTLDPALRAYFEWLDERDETLTPAGYDRFAEIYRWTVLRQQAAAVLEADS